MKKRNWWRLDVDDVKRCSSSSGGCPRTWKQTAQMLNATLRKRHIAEMRRRGAEMKLEEWIGAVSAELKAAGFEVSTPDDSCGFPLVKRPESHAETVRLLKFETSLAADRRIYAEGIVFIPVEMGIDK